MRGDYRIRFVENGLIVTDEEGVEFSYQEGGGSKDDLERWCELLYVLSEHAGFVGGKHDSSRLYICLHPGYDNDEFYEKECPICGSIAKEDDWDG